MRNRIAATFGAIALIVVAVVVRGMLAGDDSSGGSGAGGGGGGRRPIVACSPGVEAVCEALAAEGVAEEATTTLDLDSDGVTAGVVGDVEVDAWITWDPAGAIANFDIEDGRPTWGEPIALGSSEVAVAVADEIPTACADDLTWTCLAGTVSDGTTIAVGRSDRVDGLLRTFPFADQMAAAEDASIPEMNIQPITKLAGSPQVAPSAFSMDSRTFVTRAGAFDILVGPLAGLDATLTGRTGFQVVQPEGTLARTPMNLVVTPWSKASTTWVERARSSEAVTEAVRAAGVDPGSATLAGTPDAGDLHALRERLTGP